MDANAFLALVDATDGATCTETAEGVVVTGEQVALDKLAALVTPSSRAAGRDVYVVGYVGAWSGRLPPGGPRMRR